MGAPGPQQGQAPQQAPQGSMPPQGAPGAAPGVERQHVHSSYIWLGSLRAVGLVIVVLLVSSISSVISLLELLTEGAASAIGLLVAGALLVGGVVALFGIVVLIHFLAYRHLWYEVGPEEFSLYSGILSKKRVHVPYQRIQSVDQRASLLQRVFGVCNVSIDTAGGASNKAVLVPYLTKHQADMLRTELFARKQGALGVAGAPAPAAAAPTAPTAPIGSDAAAAEGGNVLDAGTAVWDAMGHGAFAGQAVDEGAVSYEYGLTNKELVFTGLSNNTAFVVAILVVLGAVLQMVSLVGDLVPEADDMMGSAFDSLAASAAAGPLVALAIGGIIAIAVVVWLVSIVGACISYGGFRARRRGDRIEVERGLLQHQIQGVSIGRVQSVVVKQSLVRRIMGYCEVSLGKIDAATGDEAKQKQNGLAEQGLIVHPFVKVDHVPDILAGLVPELADRPMGLEGLPKVALRRGIIRRVVLQGGGFWMAVSVAVLQVVLNAFAGSPELSADPEFVWVVGMLNMLAVALYCLCVVLAVLDAIGAVMWQRASGFAVSRRFMTVVNGGLSTETVTFPRQKIQYGYAKTNPFQRRAGTATINARTAAGVGGTTVRLIDVSAEAADGWLEWLKPRTA